MTSTAPILLPRQADHFYWLGRYLERALRRTTLIWDLQALVGPAAAFWQALPASFTDEADYEAAQKETPGLTVPHFYFQQAIHGIPGMIEQARTNARSVRSILPELVWEQANRLFIKTRVGGDAWDSKAEPAFGALQAGLFALAGFIDNFLPHDDRWHFYRLGQLLERAEQVIGLCSLVPPAEQTERAVWNRHLRRLLGGCATIDKTAGLPMDLLTDRTNPLSPLFNLLQADPLLRLLSCVELAEACMAGVTEADTDQAAWLVALQRRLDTVHQGIRDFIGSRSAEDDDLRLRA